eukprot:747123-Hanusia_phi.AAC.4
MSEEKGTGKGGLGRRAKGREGEKGQETSVEIGRGDEDKTTEGGGQTREERRLQMGHEGPGGEGREGAGRGRKRSSGPRKREISLWLATAASRTITDPGGQKE